VHGNGGRAMHFYVQGDRSLGKREGHMLISRAAFDALFPDWWLRAGHPSEPDIPECLRYQRQRARINNETRYQGD